MQEVRPPHGVPQTVRQPEEPHQAEREPRVDAVLRAAEQRGDAELAARHQSAAARLRHQNRTVAGEVSVKKKINMIYLLVSFY